MLPEAHLGDGSTLTCDCKRVSIAFRCRQFIADYTDPGLKRLVVEIRKASRIDFTIHTLRHSFATLMLEVGSLSRMMRHSDIKATAIYLSASDEHRWRAAKLLKTLEHSKPRESLDWSWSCWVAIMEPTTNTPSPSSRKRG